MMDLMWLERERKIKRNDIMNNQIELIRKNINDNISYMKKRYKVWNIISHLLYFLSSIIYLLTITSSSILSSNVFSDDDKKNLFVYVGMIKLFGSVIVVCKTRVGSLCDNIVLNINTELKNLDVVNKVFGQQQRYIPDEFNPNNMNLKELLTWKDVWYNLSIIALVCKVILLQISTCLSFMANIYSNTNLNTGSLISDVICIVLLQVIYQCNQRYKNTLSQLNEIYSKLNLKLDDIILISDNNQNTQIQE